MPDWPAVSSAAPTLYQTMWVTTGARWSGMTTTCIPLASLNSTAFGAIRGISAAAEAGAGVSAKAGIADISPPRKKASGREALHQAARPSDRHI